MNGGGSAALVKNDEKILSTRFGARYQVRYVLYLHSNYLVSPPEMALFPLYLLRSNVNSRHCFNVFNPVLVSLHIRVKSMQEC